MSRNVRDAGRVALALIFACAPCLSIRASAQQTPKESAPTTVESDPIKCWWKTDKSAVQVGEPFTLALTCGVIETPNVTVTTDVSRLDPVALDLSPFEVVGGTRHKDISAPPWRYFQYSYTLRLIADDDFGKDIDVPAIQVLYNIQSSGGNGARGRDQVYVLPALPLRILSLVPVTATDIVDASPETFADIESRLFRANGELAAAGIFFAFALVVAGFAVVRTAGRYRTHASATPAPLSLSAVLHACVRDAELLKTDVAREGWTPELVSRALTIFRLAGAAAAGQPIAQTRIDRTVSAREGQLVVRKRFPRPARALVSASTTAASIQARLAQDQSGGASKFNPHVTLEDIREALKVFGGARYGRRGDLDSYALDAALSKGMHTLRGLRKTMLWPMRTVETFAKAAAGFRETVWSR